MNALIGRVVARTEVAPELQRQLVNYFTRTNASLILVLQVCLGGPSNWGFDGQKVRRPRTLEEDLTMFARYATRCETREPKRAWGDVYGEERARQDSLYEPLTLPNDLHEDVLAGLRAHGYFAASDEYKELHPTLIARLVTRGPVPREPKRRAA